MIDFDEFKASVIAAIAGFDGVIEVAPNADDGFQVDVTMAPEAGGAKYEIYLGNIFNRLLSADHAERQETIDGFLAGIRETVSPPQFRLDEVFALLRPADYVEGGRWPLYEPFLADVVLVFVHNGKKMLRAVDLKSGPGLTRERLDEAVAANRQRLLPLVREETISPGAMVVTLAEDVDLLTALVLDDAFWAAMDKRYPQGAWIAMPRRDQLFLFDKQSENGLDNAREIVRATFKDGFNLLSSAVFERVNGTLRVAGAN